MGRTYIIRHSPCFRRVLTSLFKDWCLIPAWACTVAIAACGLGKYYTAGEQWPAMLTKFQVMWHYEGQGNPPYKGHDPILIPERLFPTLKAIYALILILLPAYALTRYSILALYLRVFSPRWLRLLSWFFVGFITCQWLAYTFAAIFQCHPVAYYWDREIPGGKCFNVDKFNKAITPANVAADCIILVMPLPTIWKMHASKLRKAGYTIILGLGIL